MPLASDLMEPIRPFVDYMIINYIREKDLDNIKFNKDFKEYISIIINQTTLIQNKAHILDNAIPIYISSIKNVIIEKDKPFIHLPRIKE